MSDDKRRPPLSKAERDILAKIELGEVAAACLMPVEDTVETAANASDWRLQKRLVAGENLLQTLDLVPRGPDGAAAAMRSGLILLRSFRARRVIILFNGNTAHFTLPRPLALNQTTHVVMLRDPSRCFGFAGIPELGQDYATCLVNLRRIIAALGVAEVYCMGISSGGSAALRVGCDLQADGILGFSVPTTLDLNDDPGAELRQYPQLTRLYKTAREFGIDLAQYYESCVRRPGLILVYSQDHGRDSWLAGRMNGMHGVELVPTPGFSGHTTFQWLHDKGTLPLFIQKMFALTPVECRPVERIPVGAYAIRNATMSVARKELAGAANEASF